MTFLMILSIASIVTHNCFSNYVVKKTLSDKSYINLFNAVKFLGCVLAFGVMIFSQRTSLYTVIIGVIFGVVTAIGGYFSLLALSSGPMHLTMLITTSSMIIPTMSGVFFGEAFSFGKLCVVFVLIFFIYLSFDKKGKIEFNKKWLVYCLIAFVFEGTIGVIQKIHQSSEHREETSGFLFIAFLCAFFFSLLQTKKGCKITKIGKINVLLAAICAICTFAMHSINLKLSGIVPSQLFFPIINGCPIVLSSICSVVIFKEKTTKQQTIGLVGGILSLIGICLVK